MNKGIATRHRIIAQAAPIFNQRGFEGTSMNDIMEATGLEKGGLYRHFPSKQALAAAAFKYSLRTVTGIRMTGTTHPEGSLATLRHIVHQFVTVPSPIPGGCPLMNTAIDSDDGNPALRKLASHGIRAWKKKLCAIVTEGIRNKEIEKSVKPESIANLIIATLEGALMIARLERDRTALLDAQAALDIMLSGLAPRPKSA